jgi:hypothetical protein
MQATTTKTVYKSKVGAALQLAAARFASKLLAPPPDLPNFAAILALASSSICLQKNCD